MHWIALQWLPEEGTNSAVGGTGAAGASETPLSAPSEDPGMREALGWWALGFTPRVAWVDEALLLEVSGSLRLWGGRQALLRRILESNPVSAGFYQAQAASGVIALARLRLRAAGQPLPGGGAGALPLDTLTAARPHLDLLARLGCRNWGDVTALPRGPLVRRFGTELRAALDVAWGLAPESYRWLTLPDVFDQSLELPTRVEDAQALMWSANRLLTALQIWLRARQLGVLAFELKWTLDLKRLDGRPLPPDQALVIRTAEPAQSMAHLRRLLAERLAQVQLLAPAAQLRLRSLETAPWQAGSVSFLPEEQRHGEPLHAFVERLSARLGSAQVLSPAMNADHRPECAQEWRAAVEKADKNSASSLPDALAPTWLLREPLPLEVQDGQPCHRGVLRLLTGPRRIEAGWWGAAMPAQGVPAARDYYIAQNPTAELLWVYRERPTSQYESQKPRWFLQGLYA
ncbi:MAG: DNA polymerase Y family protein [Ottowia sp.]|uniref:Y-family DNA polymerase n=1 Tax=Ottowia sp. TaxID=1898956 RepID=UPI003C790B6D